MGDVRDLSSARRLRGAPRHALEDELELRAEHQAPRTARHWVMATMAEGGVTGAPNQAIELLTGELVSNAVAHGPAGGEVLVRLRVDRSVVRVSVRDEGGGRPRLGHPDIAAASGRGLVLVEALSSAWGIVTHPDGGKTVWFEVDTAS